MQVVAGGGEEPVRDRHHPVMAAFAFGDEQAPFTNPQIAEAETEDFAAAEPAEDHREDHRPVPIGAQRGDQPVDL